MDDEQHTAIAAQRRKWQFGILELLTLTTCLALSLGLYANVPGGIAIALVLTTSLAVVGWHAKRIENRSELRATYNFAALVLVSLVIEMLLAWAYGYFGAYARPLYLMLIGARMLLLTLGGGALIFDCIHYFSGDQLPWEHPKQRMGVTCRIAVAVLCVPYLFTSPLHHYGLMQMLRSVDVAALAVECKVHTKNGYRHAPSVMSNPMLCRMGVRYVTAGSDGTYSMWDEYRNVAYLIGPSFEDRELQYRYGWESWRSVHSP